MDMNQIGGWQGGGDVSGMGREYAGGSTRDQTRGSKAVTSFYKAMASDHPRHLNKVKSSVVQGWWEKRRT